MIHSQEKDRKGDMHAFSKAPGNVVFSHLTLKQQYSLWLYHPQTQIIYCFMCGCDFIRQICHMWNHIFYKWKAFFTYGNQKGTSSHFKIGLFTCVLFFYFQMWNSKTVSHVDLTIWKGLIFFTYKWRSSDVSEIVNFWVLFSAHRILTLTRPIIPKL